MSSTWSKPQVDLALLLLRLFGGGFIITHGAPKLMKIVNGNWKFADPIGIGPEASLALTAFAEVVCAVLVILGLKTRWATIPLIIAMAVAGLIHHASDPFSGKEKPLMFLAIFLVLAITGAGKHSLDQRLSKR